MPNAYFNGNRRDFLRQSASMAASVAVAGAALPVLSAEPAPQVEASWLLGCFTRPFSEFTFAEALDGMAAAGFAAVGLMSVRLPGGSVTLADANESQTAEIREMVAERRLVTSATYYGGPPVGRSVAAGVEAFRKLIDNCAAVHCATVVLGGTENRQLYDTYYQAVADVCDYAAEMKVQLALKPHGGLNATGPECRRTIEQVNHAAFRLWYDPGNIYYYSEGKIDPVDDAATVDGLVTGMCVKDFQPPREVAVNPGTGRVDFPRLMSRLKAGGFRGGPLIVETLAPGDLKTTTANARQARQFLEKLVA